MTKYKKAALAVLGGVLTAAGAVMSIIGFSKYEVTESINKNDPMFPLICAGLFTLMIGLVILFNGIAKLKSDETQNKYTGKERVTTLTQAALFATLAFVLFMFLKIPIVAGGTAFHLGNTMVVLAALFIGGSMGGLAGAIGLTIADFASGYATSAPKTFLLKLCIGLVTGFLAHKVFKISKTSDQKKILVGTIVAAAGGLLFNTVADPLLGYVYKRFLFGIPQVLAENLAKLSSVTTAVNSILSGVCAVLLYLALRPALKKAGLFKSL